VNTFGAELTFHFYNTVVLTALVAAFALWRYRVAVLDGMRGSGEATLAPPLPAPRATAAPFAAAEVLTWERGARWRLARAWLLGVGACSLLLAASYMHRSGWEISPAHLLMVTLVFATAVAPMIAVALAVPFWRGLAGTALLLVACALLTLVAGLIQRAASGRPITEEYIEKYGIEAYAEFEKAVYIEVHGQDAYDAKFGDLEAIGCEGTWEPCHKQMLGHGIVGVENLGGDLDKVKGKRFRFYCFPIRWYMGDGSMVRCVAEIDEDDLNDVPERTYTYCGTGYGPASEKERYDIYPLK